MDKSVAARVEQEIIRLCHAGLDSRALRVESVRRLRKVVPIDSFWFATADPATLLFTSSVVENIPEEATPSFVANEFLQPDINKWTALAGATRPVNGLYAATRGEPDTSPRYREILEPLGWGDELRAVLRYGGACWGFMCLHRDKSRPGFTAEDIAFLHRLTPHLATGLRTALLLANSESGLASEGPGLLVLADDLSIVATTRAAERWLAELADWPCRGELPQAVYGVAARLRALEREERGQADLMPRARIRTASGRWLLLHASTNGRGRGRASISSLTVQQHLKAVFDKTGVRSRRDLVAQIFTQQYLPHIQSGAPLAADGWFTS